jgi:hypothetical protein
MNHFYDIWTKAVAGKNSFIPCKVQWYEVEGRDEKWLQKQIQDNGEMFVRQEYMCLTGDSKVKVQDSYGKVQEITLEELYTLEQENLVV